MKIHPAWLDRPSYTMYNNRMHITIHLRKWGNSLGIRLPSAIARDLRLTDGTEAELTVENGEISIRPTRVEEPARKRRPLSFYERRAKERGLTSLMGQPVEIMPDDAPRGREAL